MSNYYKMHYPLGMSLSSTIMENKGLRLTWNPCDFSDISFVDYVDITNIPTYCKRIRELLKNSNSDTVDL